MSVITKDLGAVTAYAAAVNRGYTGTREEFETLMASYAYVGEQAAESASNASQSATDASQSATDAETAKGTAQQAATDAQTAQASAQGYAQSAQQSAQSASQSAQSAESAKNTAVNAVDGFAAGAQQALDSVNSAGNNWKSLAQAQKLDSEAWAVGTRNGEDVGAQDETYHNNAKYYAQQGGTSAQTASDAAQTATTKASEAQASASAAAESARTLTIDRTLTQSGQAADAKETGDKIISLKEDFNLLNNFAESITDRVKSGVTLDFQNKTGYWSRDKTYVNYTTYQVRNASVSVNGGDEYLLTSASFYYMARVAFFDENDAIIDVIWSSNDNALQTDTYIKVPSSATTMLVQAVGDAYSKAVLKKIGAYITSISDEKISHGQYTIKAIIDDNFVYTYNNVAIDFEAQDGYYARSGNYATNSGMYADTISVIPGEKYLLTSKSYYEMARVVFFDTNDVIVSMVWSSNDAMLHTDTPVTVPQNAASMRIQKYGNSSYAELKKEVGITLNITSVLKGKKLTAIGDSITEYNSKAKTNWLMYIASWAGADIQNLGSSGTGFAKSSPYINRISSIQDNPDIIGVALSWNDLSAELPVGDVTDTGTASLSGYANDFFDELITNYPTTPIICYCQGPWNSARYGKANSDAWFEALSEICARKGIPFYGDLYKGCTLKPWNDANKTKYFTADNVILGGVGSVDGVHPNSEGHKVIARYLYPKFAENIVEVGLDYLS